MKKLIDIPDESIKGLKILAVNDNTSFKAYLQDVLVKHSDSHDGITELARELIGDEQSVRAILNYLSKSYYKLYEFDIDGIDHVEKLKDKKHFYNTIIDCCNHELEIIKEDE